jgi:hypothetical protein
MKQFGLPHPSVPYTLSKGQSMNPTIHAATIARTRAGMNLLTPDAPEWK